MKKLIQQRQSSNPFLTFILVLILFSNSFAQNYTRGLGIYPGDKKEDFSPTFKIDSKTYRNLALNRPAYQSGSYDYNLTAQLITDGIIDSTLPSWISVTSSTEGAVKKNEREWILDRNPMTKKNIEGSDVWLQLELSGNNNIPEADSINLSGSLLVDSLQAKPWEISVSGSNDSLNWQRLGFANGNELPGDTLKNFLRRYYPQNLRVFNFPFKLKEKIQYRFYRINLNSPNAKSWAVSEFGLFNNGERLNIGGPYSFTSAWMSASPPTPKGTGGQAGSNNEWVYVDLGTKCSFDRIALYWIRRPAKGFIQVSDNAVDWKKIQALSLNSYQTDNIKFKESIKARYVRILMTKPTWPVGRPAYPAGSIGTPGSYILSEIEIYGTGGPITVAHAQPSIKNDGRIDLSGGKWKLQRESLVKGTGEELSKPGYNTKDWIIATVPGTELVSYLNAGAIPDPTFGDNQLLISDSFFYSNFWYRDELFVPSSYKGKQIFLNFDGINWKAEVFLNGKKLGLIEGAFTRKRFDVTGLLVPRSNNVIAVRVFKNNTPGFVKEQTKYSHDANGGELGADNPTFHASVGWDWIPTIRGRNTGIWSDVYLSTAGPVTIENPFVSTKLPLPDTSSAEINIEVTLQNHTSKKVNGIFSGKFGDVQFEQPVVLDAMESKTIKLNPSSNPAMQLHNPKLWWPNGYGLQNLYNVELKFITADKLVSDAKSFKSGVREMSYSEDNGVLRIWVNGKRFIGKGGNWGFPESLLRYRTREYDIAVRYHKEMNFTMIRNWIGQTADDAFFDACDRYGIMIWQDFWLANPLDGPNPNDNKMFLSNAEDFVKRIRNHPSLALYCGRNEGNPPDTIDMGLRKLLSQFHPDVHYISNSAFGVVSGGGPYRAMPVKFYFESRATEKLHSEIGMPNMVSYESLKRMLPDSALWPIDKIWGVHDFTLEGAQSGASFNNLLENSFGKTKDLKEWLTLAQWINYQGYRAIFEAQSKNRMGILLWMSHPAWPSMVWQTYDYYFEPTAAYFACKKACEPLHIQWNSFSDSIEVVNYSSPDGKGLTAKLEIYNINGKVILNKETNIDCPEDNIVRCFKIEYPDDLTNVYFIRLKLEKENKIISENFYWSGIKEGDLEAVKTMPKVKLTLNTKTEKIGNQWFISTKLFNNSTTPALMVKLKVLGNTDKKRILPVIFSDNYISLMPGEQQTIKMELQDSDTRGEKPVVSIEGINIDR